MHTFPSVHTTTFPGRAARHSLDRETKLRACARNTFDNPSPSFLPFPPSSSQTLSTVNTSIGDKYNSGETPCYRLCVSLKIRMKSHLPTKTAGGRSLSSAFLYRLYKEKKSVRAVTQQLCTQGYKVSRSTVHRRLREYGEHSETTPVVGQQKLSNRGKRYVVRQVMVHHSQSPRETMACLRGMGVHVSRQTVWRALRSHPYLWAKRPRKGIQAG